jgi:acetoin:2,6-dichlorophenolindophenol oxidoreductase subunit alpha
MSETNRSEINAVDRAVWLDLVRCMTQARRIEERLIRLYHQGKIIGGCYMGIGQEAIGASTVAAAGPEDLFAPLIRDMTVHLGRGMTTLETFRHWLGRATGCTHGRDGNIHHGDLRRGVYAMISHLGAMLPVITGGVMAKRRRGIKAVGVGYIGDGATSTGDFHEAVNFAAVFDVPVLFVIENNKYAYSTPQKYQFKCKQLIDKAAGYGIEGFSADGNDAVSLYLLCKNILDDIREKPRAVMIEVDTLRMRGHGEHDAAGYVPAELKAKYAARDPLKVAREKLTAAGVLTEADFANIEKEIASEIEQALQQSLREPPPDAASFQEGVYAAG